MRRPIDLARSQFDAAIINAPSPPPGAAVQRLFTPRLAAYAAPTLVPTGKTPTAREIAELPLLHLKELPNGWQDYLQKMGLQDVRCSPASHYSLLLLSCEAALAGLGVALLPPEFVSEDVKAGRLLRVSTVEIITPNSYWLAWQETEKDSPALMAFREWLESRCQ